MRKQSERATEARVDGACGKSGRMRGGMYGTAGENGHVFEFFKASGMHLQDGKNLRVFISSAFGRKQKDPRQTYKQPACEICFVVKASTQRVKIWRRGCDLCRCRPVGNGN